MTELGFALDAIARAAGTGVRQAVRYRRARPMRVA
ncbi:MAG: hypothetical protein QOD71_1489 [Thermoleophilaceae bacterium]|nr:hypothetical protein [Thermoleophilaceae bacterium]